MAIQFPADVKAAIQDMVDRGQYQDTDEALRAAVHLLEDRNRRLEWLRNAIAEADSQIARGEGILLTPELMDEIERDVEERFIRGELPNPDVCP